jgi:hypothetical protein
VKKITRKRPNNWRPKDAAQRKEAAAKQDYANAYNEHRAKGGAPPRTPPWLIRSSLTNKWTLHEDPKPGKYAKIWGGHVDAPSPTPSPLVPAVRKVARALNAPVSGAARAAGLAERKRVRQAKHDAIVVTFQKRGLSHLLEPPFKAKRMMDIQRELLKLPKVERPTVDAFVRRLRGRS